MERNIAIKGTFDMKNFLKSRWAQILTVLTLAIFCKLTGHWEGLAGLLVFGTVESVPGYPDFTSSATGTGKIPQLFSRKAIVKFYDESIFPQISQRDYEGGC